MKPTSIVVGLCTAGLVLAACGGGSTKAGTTSRKTEVPNRIIAAPADLLSGGAPQPNGVMWVLAGSKTTKTLHDIDLSTGRVLGVVPESVDARATVETASGVVAVGVATATTGALEIRSGATGAEIASVALGAPVIALAAGAGGTTVYVLNGDAHSASVTPVDVASHTVLASIPAPLNSVGLTADPMGTDLYVLQSTGEVEEIATAGGHIESEFNVGAEPRAAALSPNGVTLYVLKGAPDAENTAAVTVATETVANVLPAPKDAVDLQLSPDGRSLYELAGAPKYGNIQILPLK